MSICVYMYTLVLLIAVIGVWQSVYECMSIHRLCIPESEKLVPREEHLYNIHQIKNIHKYTR